MRSQRKMSIVKRGFQIRGGQLGTDSFSEGISSRPDKRGLHNNADAKPTQGRLEKPLFRKGGWGISSTLQFQPQCDLKTEPYSSEAQN